MKRCCLVLAAVLIGIMALAGVAVAQPAPEFRLGFKALADQVPRVVGTPLENEHWGANGDSLQQTSNGLMAWRKVDNWTAFTNGSSTWINGPTGVQSRTNDERFDWEAPTPPSSPPPPAPVEYPVKGKIVDLIVAASQESYNFVMTLTFPSATMLEKELGTPTRMMVKWGTAGLNELPKLAPDGYTLVALSTAESIAAYQPPAYGVSFARKDFQPVAMVAVEPMVIAVPTTSRYMTLQEAIDSARLNPGKIRVRADNALQRLAILEFQKAAGVQFAIGQPYLGAMDIEFQLVSKLLPRIKSGVRVLAVMDQQENPILPGVKTTQSLGYNVNVVQSWGYAVRSGTPTEIVNTLSQAIKKMMGSADYKSAEAAKLAPWGQVPRYMDAGQFTAYWDEMDARFKSMGQ